MRKLIIAFVICLIAWLPKLDAQNISFNLSGATVVKGSELIVEVSTAEDLSALDILSYQLTFRFDPNILSFVGVEKEGTLIQSWANPAVNAQTSGLIQLAGANATEIAGAGVLLKLKFNAIAVGGLYVYLDTNLPNYFNEGQPTATGNNAFISVSNPPQLEFSPENGTLLIGESLNLTASNGTSPYQYSVGNPTVASIDANGKLTGLATGTTRVKATDANLVNDSTTGYFRVYSLRLSIKDTTSLPTKTKRVPVRLENLDGTEILSGQFQIDVYSTSFSHVEVVQEGSLLADGELSYHWSNNKLSISFANTSPLTSSGVLCYLDLTTGPSTNSQYLTLNNIVFNEDLEALKKDGFYQITPFATITLNNGALELISGENTQFSVSGGQAPYTWTSSNESVLTVDADGLITAMGGGQAYVTATDADGAKGNSAPITVKDIVVSVADTTALEISTIHLPIKITTPPLGKELSAFQGKLLFDDEKLIFNGFVNSESLSQGWSLVANETSPGMITFAGAGSDKITQSGNLLYVSFTLKYSLEVGTTTNVSLTDFVFNEGIPTNRLEAGGIEAYTNCAEEPEVQLTVNGDLSICTDQTFDVVLTATDSVAYTYAWYKDDVEIPNTDSAHFEISEAGIYNVKVSTLEGCFSFASEIVASINAYPTSNITFNGDTIICVGESNVLYANSDLATAYQWIKDGEDIPGSINSYQYVYGAGSYQVKTITNAGCYTLSNPVTIHYGFEVDIVAQSATEFCEGGSVLLQSNLLDAEQYQWYKSGNLLAGQDSTSILVEESGSYSLRALKSGCTSESNFIIVEVSDYPVIDMGSDLAFCANTGIVNLDALPSGGYWLGTAIDSLGNFDPSLAGIGTFTQYYITNNNGCASIDSLQIEVDEEVTVISSPDTTLIYDGSTLQLTANTSGGTWTGTGVSAEGLFDPTISGVGQFTLTYNLSVDDCTASDSTIVKVEKGIQTIIAENIADKEYGGPDFSFSFSGGNSGEPVILTALTDNISIDGANVSIIGTGSATIRLSQAGSQLYAAAEEVEVHFFIHKITQLISGGFVTNKIYGDEPFTINATGGGSGQAIVYTALTNNITLVDNLVNIIGVGEATIRISQAGDDFYYPATDLDVVFEIGKADQVLLFNAPPNKTFGDADFNLSATGGSSGMPITFEALSNTISISGNQVTILGAGSATIRASQSGNEFYNAGSTEQSFIINKASQTISFSAISDQLDGGADFNIEASSSQGLPITFNLIEGDISITENSVSILGPGRVTIEALQVGNSNYNPAPPVQQTFCVVPLPEITLGTDNVTLTSNYTSGNQWIRDGENIANATGNSFVATESGTYTLSVGFDDCVGLSEEAITLSVLGLSTLAKEQISIYPNPTGSKTFVLLESRFLPTVEYLGLTDLHGRTMVVPISNVETGFSLDLSSLKSGIYLLNLQGKDFQYHSRIVKE